ncbi:MAG TPA: PspC domain-containing protein, partial [Saprospiraceae bacterium]|nr:PspC domain-containing protein [Saprospiraceae bacterium]
DFGVDTAGTQANFNTGQRSGGIKTGRRIFRDPDEKILGGVCAGLSSYFGINDPIWLRIIFLLLFFVAGTGFLFYMILWILIPKAVTSADRLSMKGEPININNIAKEVEDSFNHFGQRINDIGREFSGKKKNSLNANEPYAFSGITNFVGELVEALQYIIPKIIKGFIILIGLICMFAIATAGIALLTSGLFEPDVRTGNVQQALAVCHIVDSGVSDTCSSADSIRSEDFLSGKDAFGFAQRSWLCMDAVFFAWDIFECQFCPVIQEPC